MAKVVQVNNQFYLGLAGSLRYANVIQFSNVPESHPAEFKSPDFEPFEYLVTEVVPAWLKALKSAFEHVPDTKEDWPWGVGLLVIKGRVFQIGGDFSVSEAQGNYGVGSGSDYALGALAAGKSVEKAMEIASDLDPYTGGDLHVLKGLK